MRVFQLRGLVFFGTVHRLLDRVEAALRDTPPPACVVLDCTQVSGFDSSAANAVGAFIRSTRGTGMRLVLAAAPELFRDNLRGNLPADVRDELLFEADVDHGLEQGEDVILALSRDESGTPGHLLERVFDDVKRHLDRQIVFEEMVDRLEPWLEQRDYQPGDELAAHGELQEGAQLLVKGQASVYDGAGGRISRSGPGTAVEPQGRLRLVHSHDLHDCGCTLPNHALHAERTAVPGGVRPDVGSAAVSIPGGDSCTRVR